MQSLPLNYCQLTDFRFKLPHLDIVLSSYLLQCSALSPFPSSMLHYFDSLFSTSHPNTPIVFHLQTGITNTVGRVVIGKLADLKKLDSLIMAYLSIFLCGLVTAIVPLCKSYVHLAIVAALFGLGVGEWSA